MKNEPKRSLTDFGIAVKTELMRKNKTQHWLMEKIKERDNTLYVDSSVMYKILTGEIKKSKIKDHIKAILNIEYNG